MRLDGVAQSSSGVKLKQSAKYLKKKIKQFWPFYVMLLPGLIWYAVFKYGPMYGIIIAFKDYNILKGIAGSLWSTPWYKHFEYFFQSPYCAQVISNTLIISFLKITFCMIPPVILALILNECSVSWVKRLIQTITYMPHFLSWVIISGIMIAFFSQSTGLFNRWITEAGGTTIPFLTNPEHFRAMLIGSEIWQSAGWGAIIYLAAIVGIDPSLYEAATIDGCGRFKSMWHITIPNLKGVFIMLLILRLGSVLDAGFDQIYILSNVQVNSVAEIIDTWVFKTGLEQMNYSLATAVGLLKSVIGLTLVFSANKISEKWGENIW